LKRCREHMARVAELPCCICDAYGMPQISPTQVHHCIHGRYSTARRDDMMTIPLCEGHHQGMFDTSKLAIHREKRLWKEKYGPDTDYIERTIHRINGGKTDE